MDFDKALEIYEPVLGFEVHVELNTATKMFSDGAEPRSRPRRRRAEHAHHPRRPRPARLAPGRERGGRPSTRSASAWRSAARSPPTSRFARKNYFYPDLAKNYQITPVRRADRLRGDRRRRARGRHDRSASRSSARTWRRTPASSPTWAASTGRIQGAEYSLVDYNRAGVPLVEIVTKPIFGAEPDAPELAKAYVRPIRDIVIAPRHLRGAHGARQPALRRQRVAAAARAARRSAPAPRRRTSTRCARWSARCGTRSSGRRPSSRRAAPSPRRRGTGTRTPGRRRPGVRSRMPTTTATSRSPTCCRSSRRWS